MGAFGEGLWWLFFSMLWNMGAGGGWLRLTSSPWFVRYKNPTRKMASRSWVRVSALVSES